MKKSMKKSVMKDVKKYTDNILYKIYSFYIDKENREDTRKKSIERHKIIVYNNFYKNVEESINNVMKCYLVSVNMRRSSTKIILENSKKVFDIDSFFETNDFDKLKLMYTNGNIFKNNNISVNKKTNQTDNIIFFDGKEVDDNIVKNAIIEKISGTHKYYVNYSYYGEIKKMGKLFDMLSKAFDDDNITELYNITNNNYGDIKTYITTLNCEKSLKVRSYLVETLKWFYIDHIERKIALHFVMNKIDFAKSGYESNCTLDEDNDLFSSVEDALKKIMYPGYKNVKSNEIMSFFRITYDDTREDKKILYFGASYSGYGNHISMMQNIKGIHYSRVYSRDCNSKSMLFDFGIDSFEKLYEICTLFENNNNKSHEYLKKYNNNTYIEHPDYYMCVNPYDVYYYAEFSGVYENFYTMYESVQKMRILLTNNVYYEEFKELSFHYNNDSDTDEDITKYFNFMKTLKSNKCDYLVNSYSSTNIENVINNMHKNIDNNVNNNEHNNIILNNKMKTILHTHYLLKNANVKCKKLVESSSIDILIYDILLCELSGSFYRIKSENYMKYIMNKTDCNDVMYLIKYMIISFLYEQNSENNNIFPYEFVANDDNVIKIVKNVYNCIKQPISDYLTKFYDIETEKFDIKTFVSVKSLKDKKINDDINSTHKNRGFTDIIDVIMYDYYKKCFREIHPLNEKNETDRKKYFDENNINEEQYNKNVKDNSTKLMDMYGIELSNDVGKYDVGKYKLGKITGSLAGLFTGSTFFVGKDGGFGKIVRNILNKIQSNIRRENIRRENIDGNISHIEFLMGKNVDVDVVVKMLYPLYDAYNKFLIGELYNKMHNRYLSTIVLKKYVEICNKHEKKLSFYDFLMKCASDDANIDVYNQNSKMLSRLENNTGVKYIDFGSYGTYGVIETNVKDCGMTFTTCYKNTDSNHLCNKMCKHDCRKTSKIMMYSNNIFSLTHDEIYPIKFLYENVHGKNDTDLYFDDQNINKNKIMLNNESKSSNLLYDDFMKNVKDCDILKERIEKLKSFFYISMKGNVVYFGCNCCDMDNTDNIKSAYICINERTTYYHLNGKKYDLGAKLTMNALYCLMFVKTHLKKINDVYDQDEFLFPGNIRFPILCAHYELFNKLDTKTKICTGHIFDETIDNFFKKISGNEKVEIIHNINSSDEYYLYYSNGNTIGTKCSR